MPDGMEVDKEKTTQYFTFWFFLWLTWLVLLCDMGVTEGWAIFLAIVATIIVQCVFQWNQDRLEKPIPMSKVLLWTIIIFMVIGMASCASASNSVHIPTADEEYRNAIWQLKDASDRKDEYCKAHPTAC